jgi:aspartate/tyrosine/aromatic aminotransferase
MNILKNVVNRIAESDKKTELASQKVELASTKDLDRKLKQLFAEQKRLDKINPAIEKLIQDQKSAKNMLAVIVKESESILSEFDKQAKDLGLSPDGVSQYKSLKNEISISKSEYLK